MDKTTLMILDELSSNLGRNISIHGLTNELKKDCHKAHYKNIYDKIKELSKNNDIILEKIGNSSIITINFKSYNLLNLLSQLELIKKQQLLENDSELGMLFPEMDTYFKEEFGYINSISIMRSKKNKALNRAEFLFIMKEPGNNGRCTGEIIWKEILDIHKIMRNLEKIHNIKLDYLIVRENEFFELIKETAHNPLKEMISAQTVLMYQENYWLEIKKVADEGISIKGIEEINPAKISEKDIIYNLGRFGYKEMGTEMEKGRDFCIETIITSLMLKGDARRIQAIPVILGKNIERGRKPIYNLLIFMAMKYKKSEKLLALLTLTGKLLPNKQITDAIEIMNCISIKPEKIDERGIKQKMEMYYANQKR